MTDQLEKLLLKLLDGTLSVEERASLETWISESPENKKLVDDFAIMWKLSMEESKTIDFQTAEEWTKLEKEITPIDGRAEFAQRHSYAFVWRIAASIAFFTLFSWLMYQVVFKQEIIVKESKNSIVMVALPDGSEVWLNQNSRLSYQEDFNTDRRALELQGEAFFNVKRDAQKPFIIQTQDANVKVLGTSFNVQAYDNAAMVDVFVSSGSVSLSSRKNEAARIILKPGETGTLTKNNHIVTMLAKDTLNAVAWKNKKLIFKSTAIDQVIESVEHYFKIRIEVKNKKVFQCRFTGSFDQPTIEEITEALSVSLDLTISKEANIYIVDGEGCN